MSNTWRTTGLTLDTGALIALDHPASALLMQARLDEALRRGGSICIPVGVVAQAWRGGRPVKLARLIRSHDVDIAVMTLSVAAPSAKCAPTVATPTPSMSTSPCVPGNVNMPSSPATQTTSRGSILACR